MATRLIYRIETPAGVGAYAARVDWYGHDSDGPGPYDEVRHPTPREDSALGWRDMPYDEQQKHHFGFASEDQMRAWFYRDEWMRAMNAVGLQLTVWEVSVEDSSVGNSQAVFRRDRATLIETRPLV